MFFILGCKGEGNRDFMIKIFITEQIIIVFNVYIYISDLNLFLKSIF